MAITKQTALVLGAGASSDYGLPLGKGLRDLVCRSLREPRYREPLVDLGHTQEQIDAFLNNLRSSGHSSVDVFLEHNPDFLSIGKHAIAATLLPCENESRLLPPDVSGDHWYEYLVNRMGAGTDDWRNNRLSVITFNYDRSFEHYFTLVIAQRARLSPPDAFALFGQIPLVHVHGSLGRYSPSGVGGLKYGMELTTENVAAAAKEILVVSEVQDTLPTFAEAEKHLLAADRIYFLGFGFWADNIRRLRIFERAWPEGERRPFVGGTSIGFDANGWKEVERFFRGLWVGAPYPGGPKDYLRDRATLD